MLSELDNGINPSPLLARSAVLWTFIPTRWHTGGCLDHESFEVGTISGGRDMMAGVRSRGDAAVH